MIGVIGVRAERHGDKVWATVKFSNGSEYDIKAVDSAAGLVDWYFHLSEKAWCTPRVMRQIMACYGRAVGAIRCQQIPMHVIPSCDWCGAIAMHDARTDTHWCGCGWTQEGDHREREAAMFGGQR